MMKIIKKNKHDENKTHFKKVHYVTHLKTLKHKKKYRKKSTKKYMKNMLNEI